MPGHGPHPRLEIGGSAGGLLHRSAETADALQALRTGDGLSHLIGKYDNIVAFGQERALVVWQRIILPDGSSIVIDNLPATDTGGYAGLADQVDLHTWKLLKGVALATVLGVGSELAFGSTDGDILKALQQSIQLTTDRAGQRLVERNLNVQPTVTVRPGWPLRVIVHKDLVVARPYRGTPSKMSRQP
jgi:type IV secretion system protein TrbI